MATDDGGTMRSEFACLFFPPQSPVWLEVTPPLSHVAASPKYYYGALPIIM